MNETLLAEDMKSTPKTAFVNKPYTQEERTKRDEEELEQLKKEHAGEVEEVEVGECECEVNDEDDIRFRSVTNVVLSAKATLVFLNIETRWIVQ